MAFTEKLAKKLKKILAKAGLDEEKIDEVVDEVESATSEEDIPDDVNHVDEGAPTPSDEPVEEPSDEEVPPKEQPVEEPPVEEPPVEEVPPVEVPPVPAQPGDGSIESVVNDFVNGVAPQEEPQPEVPPEVAPIVPPQADPQVQDLLARVEELSKANEGLLTRIASLEDALRQAGIIDGTQELGDERPTLPENANNGQGNILNDILKQINNKI